jgi:hypothetical protein
MTWNLNDAVDQIHKVHLCREGRCDNHGYWCWVSPAHEHFEVRAMDGETWVKRVFEGRNGASITNSPAALRDYWRRNTGNKLRVDRHTRKKRKLSGTLA